MVLLYFKSACVRLAFVGADSEKCDNVWMSGSNLLHDFHLLDQVRFLFFRRVFFGRFHGDDQRARVAANVVSLGLPNLCTAAARKARQHVSNSYSLFFFSSTGRVVFYSSSVFTVDVISTSTPEWPHQRPCKSAWEEWPLAWLAPSKKTRINQSSWLHFLLPITVPVG